MEQLPTRMFGDFVLVKMIPVSETPGGIALPGNADPGEVQWGRVILAGPGRYNEFKDRYVPLPVGDGDHVMVGTEKAHISGIAFTFGGDDYLICSGRAFPGGL